LLHSARRPAVNPSAALPITGRQSRLPTEEEVKEYRDEAMKHLEAAERAEAQDSVLQVNTAIASSLIAIAETLHAIRASLDKLAAE
jgi:hypothetical protein